MTIIIRICLNSQRLLHLVSFQGVKLKDCLMLFNLLPVADNPSLVCAFIVMAHESQADRWAKWDANLGPWLPVPN